MPFSVARIFPWLLCLGIGVPTVRADLKLVFGVTLEIARPTGGASSNTPLTKKYETSVVLGSDYLSVVGTTDETHVDFKTLRVLKVDRTKKTYEASSLYSEIASRTRELRNRSAMGQSLAGAEMPKISFEEVLLEHLFSLRGKKSKPLVATEPAQMKYAHGKKPLFSASTDGKALTDEEATWFVRFLRYAQPLHPDILAALLVRKEVPREFDAYRYDVSVDHFHYVLLRSENVARSFDPVASAAGLAPAKNIFAKEEIARANALTPAEFTAKCDALIETSRALAKAERPFEALLLALEYNLSTGTQRTEEISSMRVSLERDASAQRFLAAVDAETKSTASKAAGTMFSLRNKAKVGTVVLKFHEACHLVTQGKQDEANKLFTDVLREAPLSPLRGRSLVTSISHDSTARRARGHAGMLGGGLLRSIRSSPRSTNLRRSFARSTQSFSE